jgi:hypothetical protein
MLASRFIGDGGISEIGEYAFDRYITAHANVMGFINRAKTALRDFASYFVTIIHVAIIISEMVRV